MLIWASDFHSSPNIIKVIISKRMRRAEHVARMEEVRNVYNILVGKPEGEGPLVRSKRKWEDNIKIEITK
jgi:hypothetical protein